MPTVLLIAMMLTFSFGTQALAQKAPAGCITCQSLCKACEQAGKQNASGKCAPSCSAWAARAGVKQIYVRRDLSACGSSPTAYSSVRCN